MSLHKSLKSKNELARARNVLSRNERLAILKEKGRWQEGDSVYGLPKVRTRVKFKKKAKKEVKPEEEAAPEAPDATADKEKEKKG